MRDLQERYGVEDSFFQRYFIRNAENRYVNDLKRFMLWREGHFLQPQKKLEYVRQFLETELENFFVRHQFFLPQIGFSLTTRCTLQCRDCIALSPLYDSPDRVRNFVHRETAFADYRKELDLVAASVDGCKRLFLHGGEPLMNREIAQIVAYSAQCDKIELVELITNGTIVPSPELLDVLEQYRDKVYLAINNYSVNPKLQSRLHYREIIEKLNERSIRHPLYSELSWFRQHPLEDQGYSPEQTRRMFADCWCKHSLQILDGILAICPRASIGHLLGIVPTPAGDIIDLHAQEGENIREQLLRFYARDSFVACGYCAPQAEVIPPAEQRERDDAPRQDG